MSKILSSESSSKYNLSHSSKSVLTVSGLQFTTTVFLLSCRNVRMQETAHQSNSTLLPANRTTKLGEVLNGQHCAGKPKKTTAHVKVWTADLIAQKFSIIPSAFSVIRKISKYFVKQNSSQDTKEIKILVRIN